MTWRLTQWLCPESHCAWAAAWSPDDGETRETLVARIEEHARACHLNPWCGICGQSVAPVHSEFPPHVQTRFQVTMIMGMAEIRQRVARELLDRQGLTFESRQANRQN